MSSRVLSGIPPYVRVGATPEVAPPLPPYSGPMMLAEMCRILDVLIRNQEEARSNLVVGMNGVEGRLLDRLRNIENSVDWRLSHTAGRLQCLEESVARLDNWVQRVEEWQYYSDQYWRDWVQNYEGGSSRPQNEDEARTDGIAELRQGIEQTIAAIEAKLEKSVSQTNLDSAIESLGNALRSELKESDRSTREHIDQKVLPLQLNQSRLMKRAGEIESQVRALTEPSGAIESLGNALRSELKSGVFSTREYINEKAAPLQKNQTRLENRVADLERLVTTLVEENGAIRAVYEARIAGLEERLAALSTSRVQEPATKAKKTPGKKGGGDDAALLKEFAEKGQFLEKQREKEERVRKVKREERIEALILNRREAVFSQIRERVPGIDASKFQILQCMYLPHPLTGKMALVGVNAEANPQAVEEIILQHVEAGLKKIPDAGLFSYLVEYVAQKKDFLALRELGAGKKTYFDLSASMKAGRLVELPLYQ